MKARTPKTKSSKSSWPAILALKYPTGKTAFQVACMIQGKRIREAYMRVLELSGDWDNTRGSLVPN